MKLSKAHKSILDYKYKTDKNTNRMTLVPSPSIPCTVPRESTHFVSFISELNGTN